MDHSATETDPSELPIPPATIPLLFRASPPVLEKGRKGSEVTSYRSAAKSGSGRVLQSARITTARKVERRCMDSPFRDGVSIMRREYLPTLTVVRCSKAPLLCGLASLAGRCGGLLSAPFPDRATSIDPPLVAWHPPERLRSQVRKPSDRAQRPTHVEYLRVPLCELEWCPLRCRSPSYRSFCRRSAA